MPFILIFETYFFLGQASFNTTLYNFHKLTFCLIQLLPGLTELLISEDSKQNILLKCLDIGKWTWDKPPLPLPPFSLYVTDNSNQYLATLPWLYCPQLDIFARKELEICSSFSEYSPSISVSKSLESQVSQSAPGINFWHSNNRSL